MLRRLIGTAALAATLGCASGAAAADRALVIGIDRYGDDKLDVGGTSSASDVTQILDLLTSPAMGYTPDDIRILIDADATRAEILSSVRSWLIAETGPNDRVFFYFSGQGYFTKDESGDEEDGLDEVLLPADAVVEGGEPPRVSGGILDDELKALFAQMTDRKVTAVVDAGTSGLVSKNQRVADAGTTAFRAANFGTTRAIVVEPSAKAQKAEGAPLDTDGLGDNVAVFTAAAGGQAPIVADGKGTFTTAFVEAAKGAGDANGNGVVSNAEIIAHVKKEADAACAHAGGCELGLTPTLEPAIAAGGSPVKEAAPPSDHLTADRILDYFGKGNTHGVIIEQYPPSPVKVGTRDIKFRILSPTEGTLVLFQLGDDGTLTQLFPNQYTQNQPRAGFVLANSPITIPDDYYGIKFNATSPSSGYLIAIVSAEPIELPTGVKTRAIQVIPKEQAVKEIVEIVAVLDKPVDTAEITPTRTVDWSVATLRYEVVK